MRHILKQVVTVFNMGLGGEKDGQRLTTYFWQLEFMPLVMHAFPLRPKASIWDWARAPTGIPMHTGQDLTYMLSNVPSAAVSHAEIEAGSWELGVSFWHCLDNQVSLLFVFSILWACFPSETLSCFTSQLSSSITMSMFEQSSSSHWSPHIAGLLLSTRHSE